MSKQFFLIAAKSNLAQVIVVLIVLINFSIKAPNGVPRSGIPPEIAAWLATGLSPEQQAALLEAEKRRLERAMAQAQLTKAEIKELEKTGAFTTRPTVQDIEQRWANFVEEMQQNVNNYNQAHTATVDQLNNLLERLIKIDKAEASQTPEQLKKMRHDLHDEFQQLDNQARAVRDELEVQLRQFENMIVAAEDFLQAIPPYPDLGDTRQRARQLLNQLHVFYRPDTFNSRMNAIKNVRKTLAQKLG